MMDNPNNTTNPDDHDRGEVWDRAVPGNEIKALDDGDTNKEERGILCPKSQQ